VDEGTPVLKKERAMISITKQREKEKENERKVIFQMMKSVSAKTGYL